MQTIFSTFDHSLSFFFFAHFLIIIKIFSNNSFIYLNDLIVSALNVNSSNDFISEERTEISLGHLIYFRIEDV